RIGISLVLGAMLGFLAGVVGIGGGIYLVPLIVILGLGEMKEAAAAGAVFILINSTAGLIARAGAFEFPTDIILPLGLSVLVGGLLGSWLGATRNSARALQRILGVIILAAIILLARRLLFSG
ncbi:MAG: TSUP family transporter, partial [Rhodothermales bacterium]|nr:TSUP family transporter [Rhodothermales bacterium]